MLTEYVQAAMQKARFEVLEDGTHFGRIPGIRGVWANERTREDCERELRSALEDWLLFSIRRGDRIPKIGGIDLNLPVTP